MIVYTHYIIRIMVMYSISTTVKTHTKKKIEKLNSKYFEMYIARWML